jgi:hypothetical protein
MNIKRNLTFLSLCATSAFALTRPVAAHFLWAEVTPQNQARVTFGEGADEPINGVTVERIKAARAWGSDKKPLPLNEKNGFYSAALPAGAQVTGVAQTWGVLDKTAEGRGIYLLEYYAKGAVSPEAAAQSAHLPFEVFLTRDGDSWLAQAKHNGEIAKGATFTLYAPGGNDHGSELPSDANGATRFSLANAGLYALRAFVSEAKNGTLEGKTYPAIRHYSTLTFRVAKAENASPTVPASATAGNPKADPTAYALLKAAHDARQVLPEDFPGLTAKVVFHDGEKTHEGTLRYTREGGAELKIEGPAKAESEWLTDQVQSILGHRRGGDFAKGDGRHPLTLGADKNAFGQLINLNDRMQSSYRVKDNKVTEVTRVAGGSRFTISVIQTMSTGAGKYLSTHFSVVYRDEKTGALQLVQAFRDKFSQIGTAFLPIERVVMSFEPEKITPTERSIKFRDIEVLPGANRVAAAE